MQDSNMYRVSITWLGRGQGGRGEGGERGREGREEKSLRILHINILC